MKNGVLTKNECHSRYEIYLEKYYRTINIEALTLLDIVRKDVLPSITRYAGELKEILVRDRELEIDDDLYVKDSVKELSSLIMKIHTDSERLEEVLKERPVDDCLCIATYYKDEVLPLMEKIRESADKAEKMTDRSYWPYPTYKELLFGVD